MIERSWPERYRVIVHTNVDMTVAYSVLTWQSAEKAIALAVQEHGRRWPAGSAAGRIFDVTVEDLGPAERDADGTVAVGRGVIFDRMEF